MPLAYVIPCDVMHSTRYTYPPAASYDFGKYVRVVGIPGVVRYLCEDCARGRISPRFQGKLRMSDAVDSKEPVALSDVSTRHRSNA